MKVVLSLFGMLLIGCGHEEDAVKKAAVPAPAVSVQVAKVALADWALGREVVGTVRARNTAYAKYASARETRCAPAKC
jgi:multidrug efflux pump subunit AcrA (membrane-fusion protein)